MSKIIPSISTAYSNFFVRWCTAKVVHFGGGIQYPQRSQSVSSLLTTRDRPPPGRCAGRISVARRQDVRNDLGGRAYRDVFTVCHGKPSPNPAYFGTAIEPYIRQFMIHIQVESAFFRG